MIAAGLMLLAVGAADLVRQFLPWRWQGYLGVAAVLLVLGSVGDALLPAFIALAVGAGWILSMPAHRVSRAAFWPAVGLAVLCIGAVLWLGERSSFGLIGATWSVDSPAGPISFDLAVLTFGAVVFLLESGNLVVRAALDGEGAWVPSEQRRGAAAGVDPMPAAEASSAHEADSSPGAEQGIVPAARRDGFQGGRLIGPLERVLVLLLTLAAAYPILAAMLAAKGIVRFPEISRDGETGARAEYFLVGSLVSWVCALGCAFLVWWAAAL